MLGWQVIWWRITSPSPTISNRYERERASAFSAMLFVSIFLMAGLAFIIGLFTDIQFERLMILVVSAISLVFFYAGSRTQYYRWNTRIYVWFSTCIIIFTFNILNMDSAVGILFFTAFPIIVCGFLLSNIETIAYMVITTILVIIAQFLHLEIPLYIYSAPLFIVLTGLMSIITSSSTAYYHQMALVSEARYRSLMEANFEGIIVMDGKTAQILDANPAIEAISGYSAEELIGHYPIEFISYHDKDMIYKAWKERAENIPFEISIQHKNGYEVIVESRLRPYQYKNRTAFVITILDITERKQSEALIVESEERFRAIFNGSVHYIGVLDAQGKILELNDGAYEKFSIQPIDALGKHLWEFDYWANSEKLKERLKAIIKAAAEGQSHQYEGIARDKDGQRTYLDFSVKPIIDMQGKTSMIIIESRDTTNYRAAEAQSREYEQRYQSIFNYTTDAVVIFDMDGKIIDANQRTEEMLAISRENIKQHSVFDFVVEDEKIDSADRINGLRQGSLVSVVSERQLRRTTGKIFYAETLGIAVLDSEGNPQYILSMLRDISERKRQDAERFSNALAQERTQLLAHFIENASHHFRTPITNMKTRMYLLSRVFDKPEKRDEQIDILNQELERLQNILNDLLAVLRLQKDDTEYHFSHIPVNQLISEVRQAFEGRIHYSQFQWQWVLHENDPMLYIDKGYFGRAMINLVENAMTHTPAKGAITIQSFSQGKYLAMDVIDAGTGILDDDLPHIFDDFYRGQEAMAQDSTSSGLGLSITRMIIERHGGTINAKSLESGGAHFQILLPMASDWSTDTIPIPDQILDLD